ncbi:Hsp70 family protein [Umezawaea tangerina]|uniref:Hsp70 protein n=1 Tax=Umezawaea tangerina TaxID=84725 RepID=A0A2T0T023_9PSEU|nr:Hsp70 family protein [Umezawaea tangerina]PRY38963.1 Hsp70 protein [Umezawaea tangerina]
MTYSLGIDLGTTCTAAAVSDGTGTRIVRLGREATVSSAVFVAESGELITGDAAEREAVGQPLRASRAHKRRLADPNLLRIAGSVRSPTSLMAAQLRDVVDTVTRAQGRPPGVVVLTCPAVWGPYRREHFIQVPRLAGLRNVRVVTEPEAAAMHYSVERRLGDGEIVGVYDLGGGTFDATILRARPNGMEILGTPEGVEQLGGLDFDDALLAFVDGQLGGALSSMDTPLVDHARLRHAAREACRQAKEDLSTNAETVIRVESPDGTRHETAISRAKFNSLIKSHLDLTTESLKRAIGSAGLNPADLTGVLLAGGSSRIPFVEQIVSDAFGKPVRVGLHPKLTVAMGAAAIARLEANRPAIPARRVASPPPLVSLAATRSPVSSRSRTAVAEVRAPLSFPTPITSARGRGPAKRTIPSPAPATWSRSPLNRTGVLAAAALAAGVMLLVGVLIAVMVLNGS